MKGTLVVRMYLSTLNRIRREFPADKNETMISYFERLSKYMKERE